MIERAKKLEHAQLYPNRRNTSDHKKRILCSKKNLINHTISFEPERPRYADAYIKQ